MFRIAVASGKGGTGKTTIAVSLAVTAARMGRAVLLDCDVEAPNDHLYFPVNFEEQQPVELQIPLVDFDQCTGCGKCAEVCRYNAIAVLLERPVVFPELCHSCGSCSLVCPEQAITEQPRRIGQLDRGLIETEFMLGQGLLDIGQAQAVPIISQLKSWMDGDGLVQIFDSPPGASCPVVETIRDADFVVLVTEPTPFGLHDLRQAVEICQELGINHGVIINRDGIGDGSVEKYCRDMDLKILLRIPLEEEIGRGIAIGKQLMEIKPDFEESFTDLLQNILQDARKEISA
jgi:MinD superfamily P-loop ATPase